MASAGTRHRIPRDVWALGLVSLLTDMSSELVHSLLPVFLVSTLGASMIAVGVLDGAAEFAALVVKSASGRLSDRLGRRKGLIVVGYGLSALTKPLFPLAASIGWVVGARLLDRTGKGIRGAPRDALLAQITPPSVRGAAFGLRQALDTTGAIAGPLLAIGGMLYFAADIRTVLWLAVVPGVLGVLVLVVAVREPPTHGDPPHPASHRPPLHTDQRSLRRDVRELGAGYRRLVLFAMLCLFARGTEAFLVLRVADAGVRDQWVPLSLVVMSVAYAITSWPAGRWSDTVPRGRVLGAGLLALLVAHLVLATAGSVPAVLLGVALWGMHMGLTQGVLSALIADRAPPALRGTAFGLYASASGVAMLAVGTIAGVLWERAGAPAPFWLGAAAAALALSLVRHVVGGETDA